MKKKELTLAAILVYGIIGCTDKNPKISEKLDNAYNVIEGKWEIVHSEFSGRVSTSSNGTVDRIVDNEWIRPNRRTGVYTLKLNPKSNPKEVDLSANRLVNETLMGIYKIEGDKLFFCYAYNPELDRPEKFKTDLGENYYLYVLKKINE